VVGAGVLMDGSRARAGLVVASFFFFQAEDGIRDWSVTGVQTCALPICLRQRPERDRLRALEVGEQPAAVRDDVRLGRRPAFLQRSEERRVGKECRSRWSRDQEKK